MLHRHAKRGTQQEHYCAVAAWLGHVEASGRLAETKLATLLAARARLSDVRSAYRTIGLATQEPPPVEPALDRHRPPELTRRLSALRTRRQWYLMAAPRGVLTPTTVRPGSRAATGPHVSGLDFDVEEDPWGVDLTRLLDAQTPRQANHATAQP